MFDHEHTNFLLGKNRTYVTKEERFEERFEEKDGVKKCLWCGLQIS